MNVFAVCICDYAGIFILSLLYDCYVHTSSGGDSKTPAAY
jgi:hypothetical protein